MQGSGGKLDADLYCYLSKGRDTQKYRSTSVGSWQDPRSICRSVSLPRAVTLSQKDLGFRRFRPHWSRLALCSVCQMPDNLRMINCSWDNFDIGDYNIFPTNWHRYTKKKWISRVDNGGDGSLQHVSRRSNRAMKHACSSRSVIGVMNEAWCRVTYENQRSGAPIKTRAAMF